MFSQSIAMDLGTSRMRIYMEGKGVVVNEPSYAAVSNGKVLATGKDAYHMLGRTGDKVDIIRPFWNGIVNNYVLADMMMGAGIKRVSSGTIMLPSVLVSIPHDISPVNKQAIVDIIESAGVRKIDFISNSMAAAVGAGLDVYSEKASMIVDIGTRKTDCAVLAGGEIKAERVIPYGGEDLTEGLINYIRSKYGIETGFISAEELKLEIGTIANEDRAHSEKIGGLNVSTGKISSAVIDSREMTVVFTETIMKIISELQDVIEDLPIRLQGNIETNGLVLAGGCAKLPGIAEFISDRMGYSVVVSDTPEETVVYGCSAAERLQNNRT
jgi:rod shape-determining protein MreB